MKEISYVRQKKVWVKMDRAEALRRGIKIIQTRWIDIDKGDQDRPNYRSRLVGKEFNVDRQMGLFAATPPLEALKLLTSDAAGTIKWWDADLSEQPLSMVVTWHPQDEAEDRKLTHLALSPEGSEYLLVSTAAGDIQVWDLRQPSQSDLISQGSAHSHSVTQACWSPDGKQIVSVSKDSCICVWNFFG